MITSKINPEVLTALLASGGGLAYQDRGKLTLLANLNPVVRVVVAGEMSDDIRKKMNQEKIMYLLVSEDLRFGREFFPDGYFENPPYVGRPYIYGLLDCYTLWRDWLKNEVNIDLPWNLERPHGWWDSEISLFLTESQKIGFVSAKSFKQGCACFFKSGDVDVANHVGIYLEGDLILHHNGGRFSCIEPFTNAMYKRLVSVVEYEGANK